MHSHGDEEQRANLPVRKRRAPIRLIPEMDLQSTWQASPRPFSLLIASMASGGKAEAMQRPLRRS